MSEEELAVTSTEVKAITPDFIVDKITDVLESEGTALQAFQQVRLDKLQKEVRIPGFVSSITVHVDVSENSSIPASDIGYTGTVLRIKKYGSRIEVPNELLTSTYRDIMKDAVYLVGRRMTSTLNAEAVNTLMCTSTGTIDTWTNGTLGSTSLTPIVGIQSVVGGTIATIDCYNGKILLAGSVPSCTVVFNYSTLGTGSALSVVSPGSIQVKDILRLRSKMRNNTVSPDIVLVNDNALVSLCESECVVCSPCDTVKTGEVAKIADLRLLTDSMVPKGVAIMVDSKNAGFDVIARELTCYTEEELEKYSTVFHMWMNRGLVITNTLGVGLLVNGNMEEYTTASIP